MIPVKHVQLKSFYDLPRNGKVIAAQVKETLSDAIAWAERLANHREIEGLTVYWVPEKRIAYLFSPRTITLSSNLRGHNER